MSTGPGGFGRVANPLNMGCLAGQSRFVKAPKWLFDTKSSDVSPVLKVEPEALEKPVERGHEQAQRRQRNDESGRCRRPVKFALEREKVAHPDRDHLDLA